MESLLSPYLALDLTDSKGFLCGKILADLGVDVIKIEKPGGDPARKMGPFYHDEPDPEKSLFWFAYNANKKGITLDIETPEGKKLFKRLVKLANFVIESYPVGYMDSLGLGYRSLSRINPQVIMTSITAFGQTGPYANYKGTDLVAMALGGLLYISGDPDRPPVRISHPQAFFHAACHGAVGTLLAHNYCQEKSKGQHVDVSAQDSIVRNLFVEPGHWEFSHKIEERMGAYVLGGGNWPLREIWRCKDGQVCFRVMGGAYSRSMVGLVNWMKEEGMAGVLAERKGLDNLDFGKIPPEEGKVWEEVIGAFFMKHTKRELLYGSIDRGIYLAPSNTVKDLVEDKQLAERNAFVELEHPELGVSMKYPAYPGIFSETGATVRRRAPHIGEHNKEVYGGMLGLSDEEMKKLADKGVI